MSVELNTLSPKKWVGNYGGITPTIDVTDGVRIGDEAHDSSTTPYLVWKCFDATNGAPIWRRVPNAQYDFISTGMLTATGIDSTAGDGWSLQANGFKVDAGANDVNYAYAASGVDHWATQIYRGEAGEFWYLESVKDKRNPLTASEGGRVGINKQSNDITNVSLFTGAGLNDLSSSGMYTKPFRALYQFTISFAGTTDQFQWRKSTDYGASWSGYSAGIDCAITPISIENGVVVTFGAVTGHTLADSWQISASAQLPSAAFTVNDNWVDSALKTADYTAGSPTYTDHTYAVNTSSTQIVSPFSGSTVGAFYLGFRTKPTSTFWNVLVPGTNTTLVADYWNGSAWIQLTSATHSFTDYTMTGGVAGTSMSQSGRVFWDKTAMSDWAVSNPPNKTGAAYTLYWIRFRTTSTPGVLTTLTNIGRATNYIMGVYAGPWDYYPSFGVYSHGRVGINVGTELPVSELQTSSTSTNTVRGITSAQFTTDALGSRIGLRKTRGTSVAPTTVVTGDGLGSLVGSGWDGTNYLDMASIDFVTTGTIGTNRIPTYIALKAATNASPSVLTEMVRISTAGTVINQSATASNFTINKLTSGTALLYDGTADTHTLSSRTIINQTLSVAPTATTGSPFPGINLTCAAHTALTASTEFNGFYINGGVTQQFAAGAKTTQRYFRIDAPTYSAVSGTTTTNAATLAISGAPAAGTNMTLTNSYALWVQAGKSRFAGSVDIADVPYTWPASQGGALSLLQNDGTGGLTWVAPTEQWVLATPTPTGTGVKGQEYYDGTYLYKCTTTGTSPNGVWVRYAVERSW
jgi:hypothetical protein